MPAMAAQAGRGPCSRDFAGGGSCDGGFGGDGGCSCCGCPGVSMDGATVAQAGHALFGPGALSNAASRFGFGGGAGGRGKKGRGQDKDEDCKEEDPEPKCH